MVRKHLAVPKALRVYYEHQLVHVDGHLQAHLVSEIAEVAEEVLLRNLLKIEIPQKHVQYRTTLPISMACHQEAVQGGNVGELADVKLEAIMLSPQLHRQPYPVHGRLALAPILRKEPHNLPVRYEPEPLLVKCPPRLLKYLALGVVEARESPLAPVVGLLAEVVFFVFLEAL